MSGEICIPWALFGVMSPVSPSLVHTNDIKTQWQLDSHGLQLKVAPGSMYPLAGSQVTTDAMTLPMCREQQISNSVLCGPPVHGGHIFWVCRGFTVGDHMPNMIELIRGCNLSEVVPATWEARGWLLSNEERCSGSYSF